MDSKVLLSVHYAYIHSYISSSSSVFCPREGPSLQAQEPGLQFCRRHIFRRKLGNQGCNFTRDWIGAVASRCISHPTLSSASEQTLKDLSKIPGAPTWRWGEWIWLTGPSGLHRNSLQWLNIVPIRVFDQIRDPEIPVALLYFMRTFIVGQSSFSFQSI